MGAINSEGVSASRVYLPADQSHPNLLQFFIAQFPHIEAAEWESRFAEGLILDSEGQSLGGQRSISTQYAFNVF